jgi:ABC-type nitrate/sulfonate/bicarbonate transport system substrate-binding protein
VDQVVLGSFTPSVLLDVARSTGRLEEQELAVEEVPVASSPGQFRSLIDGELTVGLTSPDNVLAYRYDPRNPLGDVADVRMIAAVDRGLGLGLYGCPGCTADDLRGATVGVDVPTSGFALALYSLAESLGVPRDEYELVALGSTPKRLQALLEGRCHFTMLNAGNELVAEERGCVRLATVADRLSPYLGTVVAVVGEQHAPVAARLACALTATAAAIVGGGLRAETAAAARARLGLGPALAERYVDRLCDPREGLVPDGVVDRASLQTLIGLRAKYLPAAPGTADALPAALDDPTLVG